MKRGVKRTHNSVAAGLRQAAQKVIGKIVEDGGLFVEVKPPDQGAAGAPGESGKTGPSKPDGAD